MTRSSTSKLEPIDPEIERTFRSLRKLVQDKIVTIKEEPMERQLRDDALAGVGNGAGERVGARNEVGAGAIQNAPRTLMDYAQPSLSGTESCIRRPAIESIAFELKPSYVTMIQTSVQFYGLPNEDPNLHVANFLEICDMFRANGASDDAIRLRLFPFSLRDKAKAWLNSLPAGSIHDWNTLARKFLSKYFPPAKTVKLRNEITNFMQFDNETLYEAWERYKDLLKKCPHHELPDWLQVQTFYNGLINGHRAMVDATAGGSLMRRTPEDAYQLLDDMANNAFNWQSERSTRKSAGIHSIDTLSSMSAQLELLSKKMDNLHSPSQHPKEASYDSVGRDQDMELQNSLSKQVNYMGNYQGDQRPAYQKPQLNSQDDPYAPTYNPGWRNHPNFSYRNQNPPSNGLQVQPQEKKSELEDLLKNYINSNEARLKSNEVALKNLENQVGQLASLLSERSHGSLPSNTEKNPKEDLNRSN